ncbi:MAG: hypothetical protein GY940_07105 [bacterium]|nr:hypothetical protein [bacterium]
MIKKINIKMWVLPVLFLTVALTSTHCNGLFPGMDKSGTPADHTDNIGGALHKPGSETPFTQSSDCTSCHQPDLRGGVEEVEDELRYAPSCYQCHDKKWDD